MHNPLPIHWQSTSQIVTLNKNETHIWCANLALPEVQLAEFLAVLSPEEKHRADRFKFAIHRDRFIAAKGILRSILARYLNVPSPKIIFAFGKHGKPYLQSPNNTGIFFNSSDSHDLAVYAIAHQEVGIDIEYMREDIDPAGIAERFFSLQEYQLLQSLPENQRKEAFFNCWTRKEAFIKAIGEGLSFPLQSFAVSFTPGEPAILKEIHGSKDLAREWSIRSFVPADNYIAAMATKDKIDNLLYFKWSE